MMVRGSTETAAPVISVYSSTLVGRSRFISLTVSRSSASLLIVAAVEGTSSKRNRAAPRASRLARKKAPTAGQKPKRFLPLI